MIQAIVHYTCAEAEVAPILQLDGLRFEAVVKIVRDRLDEELRVIDYFGACNTPNLQHFFPAEMIKRGNFVMTTNFDFLIEHALLQSGVPTAEIVPVITKDDFETKDNPQSVTLSLFRNSIDSIKFFILFRQKGIKKCE